MFGLFDPATAPPSQKKLNKYINDLEFMCIFNQLLNMVLQMFKWEGLPDTCDSRDLETELLFRGSAAFIPLGDSFTNIGAAPGSGFNIHGDPLAFFAFGKNGYNKQYAAYIPGDNVAELQKGPGGNVPGIPSEVGVFVRDNNTLFPYVDILTLYAKRLADTVRRIDSISYNLVWPGILTCDDGQVETLKRLIARHDDNTPVVIGRDVLDQIGVQKIDIGVAPQSLEVMWRHYNNLFDKLMDLFGIQGNPVGNKAERTNTIESTATETSLALARDSRLHFRERAAAELSEVFGANVSVHYDENIEARAEMVKAQLAEAMHATPEDSHNEDK
jgi:hypothetical protein